MGRSRAIVSIEGERANSCENGGKFTFHSSSNGLRLGACMPTRAKSPFATRAKCWRESSALGALAGLFRSRIDPSRLTRDGRLAQ